MATGIQVIQAIQAFWLFYYIIFPVSPFQKSTKFINNINNMDNLVTLDQTSNCKALAYQVRTKLDRLGYFDAETLFKVIPAFFQWGKY